MGVKAVCGGVLTGAVLGMKGRVGCPGAPGCIGAGPGVTAPIGLVGALCGACEVVTCGEGVTALTGILSADGSGKVLTAVVLDSVFVGITAPTGVVGVGVIPTDGVVEGGVAAVDV